MRRVIYVCPFTGLCGGTRVIAEHVCGLAKRGFAAEWWGLSGAPTWHHERVPYRPFRGTDQLGAALRAERGAIKVATAWQTASWVASNLNDGDRGYYLVQDIDQETYSHDFSGSSYQLGLRPITESEWVAGELRRRWGLDPVEVGIGVSDVFRPLGIPRDPCRIFTSYRPNSGPRDLKGWGMAAAVVAEVRRHEPRASIVTFGLWGPPSLPPGVPHIHVRAPSDAKMRELYSQCGLYLMTSRHEGFGLPAAEAMACGSAVACTDANGNMEFCRHGETALVGHTVDELARHCLRLMADRGEADGMGERARVMVAGRYRWPFVLERLASHFSF